MASGEGAAAEVAGPSPVTAAEFAAAMAGFAPFEPAPVLAVAVSGGADSLALALLAADWTQARGGSIVTLTVDHRLRPEAAAEAAQVAGWMSRRGIAHTILVREGPPLRQGVQSQARAARYGLLEGWCAAAGVLHLLTGHHAEDQAETLLLRLARGSGLDGLAGMAAIVEHAAYRVLRPLLGLPKTRLAATLRAAGQAWIEDPSNRDTSYARVRLRQGEALLAAEGLTPARLAATAAHLGRARAAIETAVAAVLAQAVSPDPAGFAWLTPAPLFAAPEEIGLRALAAVLTAVAGADYPPRLDALERLYGRLKIGPETGATLGGCRLLPRRGRLLICREPAAMAPATAAVPGCTARWDGRFVLALPPHAPDGLSLGPLGDRRLDPHPLRPFAALPAAVRVTLPALCDAAGVVSVPHLGYRRSSDAADLPVPVFRPQRPLSRAGFTVV